MEGMRIAFFMLLFLLTTGVSAQQSAAANAFFKEVTDCASSLGGWKCLELDLSTEASAENDSVKVYEYSWNFGDGNRKQGTKIEHCYNAFGSYQVTMDLLDVETNTVIRNELSATVHLYPEIFPSIHTRTEDLPPTFMEFSFNDPEANFTPDRTYWRIGNDFYEGNTIRHSFPVAGVYRVEMALEKDMDFLGTVTACASKEVTIKESDVWSSQIMQFIETAKTQSQAGPFASDEVACYIRSVREQDVKVSIIPLKTLMSQIDLQEGREYEIFLFSGNHFSRKKRVDTRAISGNALYTALKDTVSAFLGEPLIYFKSVYFEKNKATLALSDSNLRETADLLLQYPFLQVAVGAYMHTGSRMKKGIETSMQRAAFIKESLVKFGVAPGRIKITSPEFSSALVNTCSALPNCEHENPAFNGKVEFKITGTTL